MALRYQHPAGFIPDVHVVIAVLLDTYHFKMLMC